MTRKRSTGAKPVIFPSKKKFYTSSKKKVSNEEVEIRKEKKKDDDDNSYTDQKEKLHRSETETKLVVVVAVAVVAAANVDQIASYKVVYQVFWHPKEMLMAGEERLPSPPGPGDLMMLLENPTTPRPQASRTLFLSLSLLFSSLRLLPEVASRFSTCFPFGLWKRQGWEDERQNPTSERLTHHPQTPRPHGLDKVPMAI